jgi:hypothetical protein
MALAAKLTKFDHPLIFVLTITLCVVGMIAVLSWLFTVLGWSGPLSVLKGGVSATPQMGPAPQ